MLPQLTAAFLLGAFVTSATHRPSIAAAAYLTIVYLCILPHNAAIGPLDDLSFYGGCSLLCGIIIGLVCSILDTRRDPLIRVDVPLWWKKNYNDNPKYPAIAITGVASLLLFYCIYRMYWVDPISTLLWVGFVTLLIVVAANWLYAFAVQDETDLQGRAANLFILIAFIVTVMCILHLVEDVVLSITLVWVITLLKVVFMSFVYYDSKEVGHIQLVPPLFILGGVGVFFGMALCSVVDLAETIIILSIITTVAVVYGFVAYRASDHTYIKRAGEEQKLLDARDGIIKNNSTAKMKWKF